MAQKVKFKDVKPDFKFELTLEDGKEILADGYESVYFGDRLPQGKYEYYTRHTDNDWSLPCSIKESKGLTVNFWGTVVTDEPIDFGMESEIEITDISIISN